MKNMFKIVAEATYTQFEMSRDVIGLATDLATYIDENFMDSDFFTLGNTSHSGIKHILQVVKDAQNSLGAEDKTLSLTLDKEERRVFERMFVYGRGFADDIKALEDKHDDIYDVAELML
jgi:hypothetical protein